MNLFNNLDRINTGIGTELIFMIVVLFNVIFSITVCLIINWKLTLIMLCIVPCIIGGSYLFSKLISNETVNELDAYMKLGAIAQEVFSSFRTVLSLNGTHYEQTKYQKELSATRKISVLKGCIFGAYMGWTFLILCIIYVVGFIVGTLYIYDGRHGKEKLTDIFTIVIIFAESIIFVGYIGPFMQSLAEAKAAAILVYQLIDETPLPNVSENRTRDEFELKESPIDIHGDIKFDHVNFTYPARPEKPILRDFTLEARKGKKTALVGLSGSGKSTCISILLRYYDVSSGTVTIGGRSITDYNINQLRQHIGVVSQEPILFNTTIYENIRYGKPNATRQEIEEAAQQANAHNFIIKLPNKYDTVVGECGIQISGGQKQRIALARAIVKQPSLLLLDEATSALDSFTEKVVQEAIDMVSYGRTIIVVAHRLTTITNADQILVFDNGEIIEQGTHNELISRAGIYQDMFRLQQIQENLDDRINESIVETDDAVTTSTRKRSKLLSDNQESSACEGKSILTSYNKSLLLRLLCMNRPEWLLIAIGCTACIMSGISQPVCTILFTKLLYALKSCAIAEQRHSILITSCFILGLGFIVLGIRVVQLAVEFIRNIRTVKQLAIERIALKRFSDLIWRAFILCRNYSIISGMLFGIICCLNGIAVAIIFWVSIGLVEDHILNRNNVLLVSIFAIFFTQALHVLMNITINMGASISSVKNVFELFDRTPSIDNTSTKGQKLTEFHGKIEFDKVRFKYPSRPESVILNNFQLLIKPGQRVALVGTSGCGKSTIIQLLERFYDPSCGRILLDDVDIRNLNIQSVRSYFGLVSQEPVLFDLTIAENIAYGKENISIEEIIEAARKANIHQFIQQLPEGYNTRVGLKGELLSGGEKQRIAIARILLGQTKALLLDEATSAMDSYNEQIVQEVLEEIQVNNPQMTSLIIAHRFSTIRSCDLICVIEKGHIVESGTHLELLEKRGVYYYMLAQNNNN
ncbi:unnamed protein product [Rotaria magnacalcarata]|uniref:Uncharacterized protein n=1 Tax=Rotaria magnacalcarata TaxID=392030 RepID=A0A819H0M7_9BILA|nr:unnamed protein product [Rotaria magnacalcarata]CAF3972505.1 unnamed protein product [Rotaria magnacalcarata]